MRDKITDYYGQEHAVPGPFHTLDMLKGANARKGGHYFDRDTMRFFGRRVAPGVIAGRIFITSEQDRAPYAAWDGQRRYTVRVMSDDGDVVSNLGPTKDTFGAFDTLRQARAWVRRYLNGETESFVAEWVQR